MTIGDNEIQPTQGVFQGAVLIPQMFNVFLDEVLKEIPEI